MLKKVTVIENEDGSIVYESKTNNGFGHIKVQQVRSFVDKQGVLTNKTLIAQIPGLVSDLKSLDYTNGTELDGIIVVKESITPFNKKHPEKDYKFAGKTGIICKFGDKCIYRKTIYSQNESEKDEFLEHTNKEEITSLYKTVKLDLKTLNQM